MRMSRLYAPTLREAPAEAETPSHRLMLQAGLIRRSASGTFTWLPLGLRAFHKVAGIVREEMERAGAQELMLPILQPAELWQESGRWSDYGAELFRLRDRHQRGFCLGPTHEEIITDLVRDEVRSYRQLPVRLFQIHTKFRDEVRPRYGVMRSREFAMKDAYSFDRDEHGLDASYEAMREAYVRVFRRAGLDARPAQADPGAIGGNATHEFVVPSAWGEARLVSCEQCGYLANVERAEVGVTAAAAADGLAVGSPAEDGNKHDDSPTPVKVYTPGMTTVAAVASHLGVGAEQLLKTLIVTTPEGEAVAAMVRGDHELSPAKLARALGVAVVEMAGPDVVEKVTSAPVGFAGPVGLTGLRIVADPAVAAVSDAVTGANEGDYHYTGVQPGRDFAWDLLVDIREVGGGDPCLVCGAALEGWKGIEVGQIFKLGTKYSESFGATFSAEDGSLLPLVMGCYGIGIGRTVATVIEQHHDDQGIAWPLPVAPYQVLVMTVNDRDAAQVEAAERLYRELGALGVEVVLDDRAERAGVKFKDADLIGWPYRLTVGPRALAQGQVELRVRGSGEERRLDLDTAAAEMADAIRKELAAYQD